MVVQNLMICRLESRPVRLLLRLLFQPLAPLLMLLASLLPMLAKPIPNCPSLLLLHECLTWLTLQQLSQILVTVHFLLDRVHVAYVQ
jgi:hypothetical protein